MISTGQIEEKISSKNNKSWQGTKKNNQISGMPPVPWSAIGEVVDEMRE